MTKTLLKEKLKSYSALAGTIFATAAAADAQVVYTDVNPDNSMPVVNSALDSYDVDFDNNGTVDISVGSYGYLYGAYQLNYSITFLAPDATSATVGSIDATYSLATPTPLAFGTAINAASTWQDTTASAGTNQYNAATLNGAQALLGTFNTGNDAYIGCRFLIGANTHYGWIRINVSASANNTTVKDFAYNATPNTAINAGDSGGLGFDELTEVSWTASANGKNVVVKATEGSVVVVDIAGRTVGTAVIADGIATINLENGNAGVYFVQITQGNTVDSKKVVLN